jgi:CRP-like cAMP-binding protein
MSRWDFLAELKSRPEMAAQILRTLARRLRQTDVRLTE